MNFVDLMPFYMSLKLALITTVILLVAGIPAALVLVYVNFKGKIIAEVFIALPMVLPPTVLGFYLLIMFSPRSGFGKAVTDFTGIELLFSFTGLVAASCIHSMPYMIQPLKDGMSSINKSLIEASYTLGKSRVSTLFNVILPNIKNSVFTGILMSFIHVAGEFGVVLMIGGSIPGETKVASIALYEKVESMNFNEANIYALILVAISVIMIILMQILRNKAKGVVL
jgi:molybdate transport system permease protein